MPDRVKELDNLSKVGLSTRGLNVLARYFLSGEDDRPLKEIMLNQPEFYIRNLGVKTSQEICAAMAKRRWWQGKPKPTRLTRDGRPWRQFIYDKSKKVAS